MNDSKNLENQNKEDLIKRIKELDNSLAIALDINDKFQRENVKLKKELKKADPQTRVDELRKTGQL
jgi:ribonuclease HII